ncbi:hypothetical protein [Enterococcus sp. AZ163]|uniref:hypothetical protein n=1 Tax=Enterococcus sp. AZ163 TaxID=2774638 RepID=UPI003D2C0D81
MRFLYPISVFKPRSVFTARSDHPGQTFVRDLLPNGLCQVAISFVFIAKEAETHQQQPRLHRLFGVHHATVQKRTIEKRTNNMI